MLTTRAGGHMHKEEGVKIKGIQKVQTLILCFVSVLLLPFITSVLTDTLTVTLILSIVLCLIPFSQLDSIHTAVQTLIFFSLQSEF